MTIQIRKREEKFLALTDVQCLQASALCACLLGVSMGQVGISIVHDVNHGSGLSSASSRYALGAIVDLVSTVF